MNDLKYTIKSKSGNSLKNEGQMILSLKSFVLRYFSMVINITLNYKLIILNHTK